MRLKAPYECLKAGGRGKHVGAFSYYHVALVDQVVDAARALSSIGKCFEVGRTQYNVIKLNAVDRISFLLYEDFAASFPALLAAVSCNLSRPNVRQTDYAERRNPPILHRKELLLPVKHPFVAEATRLTERLEQRGAFVGTATIGTRLGWQRRLDELGLDSNGQRLG